MATLDMSLKPVYQTRVVYDTVGGVQGEDVNTSRVFHAPVYVQVEAVPAATTLTVQVKTHVDASWVNHLALAALAPAQVIGFTLGRFNYVRLVRTGTGACKAFAQG